MFCFSEREEAVLRVRAQKYRDFGKMRCAPRPPHSTHGLQFVPTMSLMASCKDQDFRPENKQCAPDGVRRHHTDMPEVHKYAPPQDSFCDPSHPSSNNQPFLLTILCPCAWHAHCCTHRAAEPMVPYMLPRNLQRHVTAL